MRWWYWQQFRYKPWWLMRVSPQYRPELVCWFCYRTQRRMMRWG